jgi:DNA-binding NarL/FixJ family response regulator
MGTVVVVHRHPLLAEGVAAALSSSGIDASASADAPPVEPLQAAGRDAPLVLLDDNVGTRVGDIGRMVASIVERGAPVLLLSDREHQRDVAEGIEAGALGAVSKRASLSELVDVIEKILRGDRSLFARQRQELLFELRRRRSEDDARQAQFDTLTPREREVLAGLVDGRSAQQLATAMFVSVTTVRSQIRSILRKLGVNSQLAAVAYTRRAGVDLADGRPAALSS